MQKTFAGIAQSPLFQNLVLVAIVFASVLVGIETYDSIAQQHATLFNILDHLILWLFIAEAVIKIGAEGRQPWRYFQSSWNLFDFAIVIALILPIDDQYFVVLRTVRLLRVLRLLSALPDLQVVIRALFKSIPSMGYISVILFLVFYIYGVAATYLFGANDPIHFGSLQIALLSLFRVVTLEDWTDVMYIAMQGCDRYGYEGFEALCTAPAAHPWLGAIFFVSFVVLGGMVVVNLFVGIIVSNTATSFEELNAEETAEIEAALKDQEAHLSSQIGDQALSIQNRLTAIQESLAQIQEQLKETPQS
ncbi:MAG: ion transporter [Spirulina sp. SIO3F2]|nr:ion transporter [Spirulina sp. SIO3F2]